MSAESFASLGGTFDYLDDAVSAFGSNDIDDLFDSDAFSPTFFESQAGDQDSGFSTSSLFSPDSLVDYDQADQTALATTSDVQPGLCAPITGSDGRANAVGVDSA